MKRSKNAFPKMNIFTTHQDQKGKKLQVRIGPSLENLTIAHVNDDSNPHYVDSPYFCGFILPRIKGFPKQSSTASEKYFENKKRMFALQVSGRFKHVNQDTHDRNTLQMM